MTDKVQKIREEVVKLFNHVKDSNFESDSGAFYYLKDLLDFIDSMQEEPVSEDSDNAARDYADACGYDNDTHFMARQLCVEHFKAGAQWDRVKIINKVVEWLKENVHKYADSFVDSFELCKDLKQILGED